MKRDFWKSGEFWITVLLAPIVAGVVAAIIATGTFWGKAVRFSWSSILLIVFSVLFTWGMIAFGFRWGKKRTAEEIVSLKQKHKEETARLKRMAIGVSLSQPWGITLFPKLESPLLRLYLYVKTAIPIESKDPQAVFYVDGRKIVLKADGLHKIAVSENFKGRGIPLEKILEPAEYQVLQTLIEKHKDVEQMIVSPNLSGEDIEGIPENIAFSTFIEITS